MDAIHPKAFLGKHQVSSLGNAQYSIVLSSHWFVPPFQNRFSIISKWNFTMILYI